MLWALILHLIRNSSFVFTLAVILGLGCPGPAHSLESMITPAILLMMMLSMMEIDLRAKCNLYDMLMGFGINYLLLSGLIIGLSFFP
jgi:hypothetical protein